MEDFIFTVVLILAGVYGLCIGSFLNVVIYRVPNRISMFVNRSFCPVCKNKLSWYDNIPLFSYLFLGGKCRQCKAPISPRYPLVEAANTVLWLLCAWVFRGNWVYAAICAVACSVGICVFMIDLEHLIIPDRFQIILAVLGIAAIFFDGFTAWYSHLIGAAFGALSFWLIGKAVSAKVGKEAMGFGDVKLAGGMGLFLGWEKLLLSVLVATVFGSVILMCVRKSKHYENNREYPFGPFLIGGFLLAMLAGAPLIQFYLGLFA